MRPTAMTKKQHVTFAEQEYGNFSSAWKKTKTGQINVEEKKSNICFVCPTSFLFFVFCVRTLLLVMRTEGTENIFISYFCFLSIHLIALGILTIAFSQLFCSKDLANYLTGFSLNDFPISISKLSKWYIVKNNGNVNYFNYTSLILL